MLGSGNLGLLYVHGPRRLTLEEIDERWPALVPGLSSHEGVGFVAGMDAEGRRWVIGADGRRDLESGTVTGSDPLAPYAAHAGEVLARALAMPEAPDLYLNSSVDAVHQRHRGLRAPWSAPTVGSAAGRTAPSSSCRRRWSTSCPRRPWSARTGSTRCWWGCWRAWGTAVRSVRQDPESLRPRLPDPPPAGRSTTPVGTTGAGRRAEPGRAVPCTAVPRPGGRPRTADRPGTPAGLDRHGALAVSLDLGAQLHARSVSARRHRARRSAGTQGCSGPWCELPS